MRQKNVPFVSVSTWSPSPSSRSSMYISWSTVSIFPEIVLLKVASWMRVLMLNLRKFRNLETTSGYTSESIDAESVVLG